MPEDVTKANLLRDYFARVAAIARTRYERVRGLAGQGAASEEGLETAELCLLKADLDLALAAHDAGPELGDTR